MKLSFHGATEEVTGSCFLLETGETKILIDCGMKQGERMCVLRSMDPFSFDVKSLDAVVVTHAHFDHTGRLPELAKLGYTGPIYMTPPTKGLTDIILEDSLNIMRENAKRCGDPVPFGKEDKDAIMKQVQGIGYHTEFSVAPGVTVMFHDAGHILGSSFISIDCEGKRTVFSGDVGNDDTPILPETEMLHHADYVVCETTYGDRDHEPTRMRSGHLADFVKKIIGRHGTVIIPAFSVERTQELLYELDNLIDAKIIPQVPIYLDSPLAIRATEIYRKFPDYLMLDHPAMGGTDFFNFPGLKTTLAVDQSKAINDDHRPKIIIAGNGMMTGGRVLHHLIRYLPDEKSGLLVVGFQAPGTLGRKIMERVPKVKIYGEMVNVAAEVGNIESFSAHGDRSKLARWLQAKSGTIKKVFLVHGEMHTKEEFKKYLSQSSSAEVLIPRLNEVFEL